MLAVAAMVVLAAVDWTLAPQTIREIAQPFLAGEIRTFTCPPFNDSGFACDGTLADGGAFQVHARRGPDDVLYVGPIVYDGARPSAFVNAVREYVNAGPALQSVECNLEDARPDLFSCNAHFSFGTPTALNVGKMPDGSMRIYGVVVRSAVASP